MEERLKVDLYTDGACSKNPGPGGYAYILRYTAKNGRVYEKKSSEGFPETTNNRMELLGAIKGLEALIKPCEVTVYSDSQYLIKAFNEHWFDDWRKKDFRRGRSDEVKNIDLWEKFIPLTEKHKINFIWVKGHADNEFNNLCDRLAVKAYQPFIEK